MVIVTSAQMRAAEAYAQKLGIDSLRLMENAGTSAARLMKKEMDCDGSQVVILAGRGNNGGDACVLARHLARDGAKVTLILAAGQPVTRQANMMYERLNGSGVEVIAANFDKSTAFRRISSADLLVDGIFGIGFYGELTGISRELLEAANEAKGRRIALDLPSGLDADSGEQVAGCFTADDTISFGAYKTGQLTDKGAVCCGKLWLADIGIPTEVYVMSGIEGVYTDEQTVQKALSRRAKDCHKGHFGHALCLCGSLPMSGAAYLAAGGALKSGAGLVTLATTKTLATVFAGRLIEATYLPLPEDENGYLASGSKQVLHEALAGKTVALAGCGLGQGEGAAELIEELLFSDLPVVLDADGINLAALHKNKWKNHTCPLILTPHPGEMRRLADCEVPTTLEGRKNLALKMAEEWRAVVVLKGHETVICSPKGHIYLNRSGNPGLAKGGSGDLLAGIITGLVAQNLSLEDAASCGVWLHGAAADLAIAETGEAGLLASEILPALGKLLASLHR